AAPRGPALTTRAALLGVVVSVLAVLLALPLKTYFSQHSSISALERSQAAQQKRIAALQATVQRYDDPAYVQAQARARLHYVLPGETDYVIVPKKAKAKPVATSPATTPRQTVPGSSQLSPWWTRLWASSAQAGR
ncbi:MAG TPA: septum formation initiator family protein, partial [Mycobacteriales bacterium]|nr:septum formation initiator family protein [Mycobacteriales bacterium]